MREICCFLNRYVCVPTDSVSNNSELFFFNCQDLVSSFSETEILYEAAEVCIFSNKCDNAFDLHLSIGVEGSLSSRMFPLTVSKIIALTT